jgi:hypothetical protein
MARSYKRDKNGRFASTGGGGGGNKALTGDRRWARSGPTPGLGRTPNPYAGRGQTAADSRLQNLELANNAKYRGGSSRGKSLRQTVQAKRGVESTKQAAVRTTKVNAPSINRSMSQSANARVAANSVPMTRATSKALGAKWQSDAASLKANKARRVVATIGRESMVTSKKDTPAETKAKVAAAGARARARRNKK